MVDGRVDRDLYLTKITFKRNKTGRKTKQETITHLWELKQANLSNIPHENSIKRAALLMRNSSGSMGATGITCI